MPYEFVPMTRQYAEEICGWKYPAPYDFYNMDCNQANMDELLNGDHFGVLDAIGNLSGFFCSGRSARVPGGYEAGIYQEDDLIDVGLGMKPSITGQGLGTKFVAEVLQFVSDRLKHNKFRLVVASFNSRAIEVYRKNGFVMKDVFFSEVNGSATEFIHMENG